MVDSLRALDQAFKLASLSGKQEIEYGLGFLSLMLMRSA